MAHAEHESPSVEPEPPQAPASAESEARAVARGKAARTPFVALATVATVVWLTAGLVTAAVLLIWWLL
jgi:hypothetical protein